MKDQEGMLPNIIMALDAIIADRYEGTVEEAYKAMIKDIQELKNHLESCPQPSPQRGVERLDIACMVQEIIHEAHSRKKGSDMSDLIDKYEAKFAQPSEAEIQLRAWQEAFGTTQLTHALAKLEAKSHPSGLVLPNKLIHIDQVPPMDSTPRACGYFEGYNQAIEDCKTFSTRPQEKRLSE